MIEAEYRLRALKQANPSMSETEERAKILELTRVTIEEADQRTADARRDHGFVLMGGFAVGAWFTGAFPALGPGLAGVIFAGICLVTPLLKDRGWSR